MSAKRFNIALFLVLLLLIGVLGLFNYGVDPFGINRAYREKGFNYYKEGFLKNARVAKLFLADRVEPRTLFLGSSRVEYLAPEQTFPPEKRAQCFNFALSGGQVHEMRDLLRYATDHYELEKVYYGIDFVSMTNRMPRYREGWDPALISGRQPLWAGKCRFYLTWDAFQGSLECIRDNRAHPDGEHVKYQYNAHGSRSNRWRELMLEKKGRPWLDSAFARSTRQYERIYNNDTLRLDSARMEAFRDIHRLCRENGVDLKVFVPPVHRSQFRILRNSPNWPLYQDFLDFLGKQGSYYDFNNYEAITTDSSNYWDSQHARKHVAKSLFRVMEEEVGDR